MCSTIVNSLFPLLFLRLKAHATMKQASEFFYTKEESQNGHDLL